MVDFPDLRGSVNSHDVDLQFALRIRDEAQPFRNWLRTTEAGRDPDLWREYHLGVAKKFPTRMQTKPVVLFGFLESEVLQRLASRAIQNGESLDSKGVQTLAKRAEESKGAVKALFLDEMFNYGTELGLKWRPVCFGRLFGSEIMKANGDSRRSNT